MHIGTTAALRDSLGSRWFFSIAVLVALLAGPTETSAQQEFEFSITITNNTSVSWDRGLLTSTPVLELGAAPTTSADNYAAFAFVDSQCVLRDPSCRSASCEDGNTSILINRLDLDRGDNAWKLGRLAPGESATLQIEVEIAAGDPIPRLYFMAPIMGERDDFVAMHVPGDPSTMGAELFEADGSPVLAVNFGISGYDAGSVDPNDGTAADCAGCPPSGSCYVAPGNSSVAGTSTQPQSAALEFGWRTVLDGRYSDGATIADILPGGRPEVIVLTEGYGYAPGTPWAALGMLAILDLDDGSIRSVFQNTDEDPSFTNRDFTGFPLVEDLGGTMGFVIGEHVSMTAAPAGGILARNGNGGPLWTSRPWNYGGFWSMGPASGDVRADVGHPGQEIVLTDFGGHVSIVDGATGAPSNSFNAWTAFGDAPYGHAAIGDVDPSSPGLEIVQQGRGGGVWALGVPDYDGEMTGAWRADLPAGRAYGSGPAIADIDGDGVSEIIVYSTEPAGVFAYDVTHGASCKYQWIDGFAGFYWTSPVVGDVDGDGQAEIVTLDYAGTLRVLSVPSGVSEPGGCVDGDVELTHSVAGGGVAWFTPALADLAGDGALDVVAATLRSVEVIDVAGRNVAFRHDEPTATFYPTALVEPRSDGASIIVTGWIDGSVTRFDTPAGSNVPNQSWRAFMGGNDRRGAR